VISTKTPKVKSKANVMLILRIFSDQKSFLRKCILIDVAFATFKSAAQARGVAGAGATTLRDSGSDGSGSKLDDQHRWIIQKCHLL
jgi:hypothetical protein